MKHLASQLTLKLTLVLAAVAAAPAALAGSEILKCVDAGGHVTLTDQPCEGGAQATRLVNGAGSEGPAAAPVATAEAHPLAVQRHEAPQSMLRQQNWRPKVAQPDRALARDVATLKAARAQLLVIDADRHARPTLATIQ